MPSLLSKTNLDSHDSKDSQQFEALITPTINFNPLIKISLIGLTIIIMFLYLNIPSFANTISKIISFIKISWANLTHNITSWLTIALNFISNYSTSLIAATYKLALSLGHNLAFLFNLNSIPNFTAALIGGSILVVLISLIFITLAFFISGLYSVLKNHFAHPTTQVQLPVGNEPENQNSDNLAPVVDQLEVSSVQLEQLEDTGSQASDNSEASLVVQSSILSLFDGGTCTRSPVMQLQTQLSSSSRISSQASISDLDTEQPLPLPSRTAKL